MMRFATEVWRWVRGQRRAEFAFSIVLALSLGVLWSTPTAWAATFTFDGHSGLNTNWSTPTNWVGNVVPTSGSPNLEVILRSTGTTNPFTSNQDLAAPFVLQRLSVDRFFPPPAVNGAPLAFSNLGEAPSIRSLDFLAPPLTVNNDMILNDDLTVLAPGFIPTVSQYSLNGAISGVGGLRQAGGGQLFLGGTTANTYAGLTILDDGQIHLNKPASVIAVPGDLVINTGGSTRSLRGTVIVGNNNQIAAGASVTINRGVLSVEGGDQTLANVTFTGINSPVPDWDGGDVVINASRTLTITGGITRTSVSGPFFPISSTSLISGGTLDLNGGMRTFHVDNVNPPGSTPTTLTVSSVIANGGIEKTGVGVLHLSGANTYAGGTTVAEGVLAGNVSSLIGNIANSGTVQVQGSGTYNGVISGTGVLEKTGGGTLTLGVAQTFTGLTRISSGTLAMSASEQLDDTSALQINGGMLALGPFNETVGAVTVSSGDINGTGTLTGTSYNFTGFSGALSVSARLAGPGQLAMDAYGVLTLSGANTYTGGTLINRSVVTLSGNERLANTGSVTVGTASESGTLTVAGTETVGAVTVVNGTLEGGGTIIGSSYNVQSGSASVTLDGAGTLTKNGAGTFMLSQANAYTGGTVINSGTLTLGMTNSLPTGGSVQVNGGALQISTPITIGALTLSGGNVSGGTINAASYDLSSGAVSSSLVGSAALSKTTAGNVTLTGSNTYTGGTIVNEGTLTLAASNALPNGGDVVVNGGTLQNSATQTIGAVSLVAGNVNGGTINAASYDVQSGAISSALVGNGGLTKTTAGTVTLIGSNTYTGGTTVAAGVLAGHTNSLRGNISNNGTVRFSSGGGTYADVISGTGAVEVTGISVTFTGANSYTGGTTITNGALTATPATLPGNVALSNGNLNFQQAVASTFAGDISGTGSVQTSGAAELTLSGNNAAYAGTTSITGGGLALGSNSAIGSGPLQMNQGTSLRAVGASRTFANPFSLVFSGAGAFTFSGSEDLTLTNAAPITLPAGQTLLSTNSATMTINARVTTAIGSTIHAAAGNFVLGDASSFVGYQGSGQMQIDAGATLTLRSAGAVDLSALTTLSGGTLAAPNGVALGAGENLIGHGAVSARVAAQIGSVIAATTGNLAVGNPTSVSGFFSDGELQTRQYSVTINDANTAVLGSLTTLGDGVQTGSLVAGHATPSDAYSHLLIEQGKNLVGRGNVAGHVKNDGNVVGDGTASGERIVFDAPWTVSGIGAFENVQFDGTFAPGESPGVVDGVNLALAGKLEIELGGATPGNGLGHHDQVNDAGTFTLLDGAALSLKSFGGYLPTLGQEFDFVVSMGDVVGSFAAVEVDPWLIARGVGFALATDNDRLSARAIAVSGDFDDDSDVDGADLLAWQRSLGATGAGLAADGDGNDVVNGADLAIWRVQFAAAQGTTFATAGGLPEPTGGSLALLNAAAVGLRLARRRARIGDGA